MKAYFENLFWILLRWAKQKVDKTYYAKYDKANRDRLIRTAFPGITKELGYEKLNGYLKTHSTDEMRRMIRMLMSFYWVEVARTQATQKYDEARNYQ